jgi:hypothetical protein
MKDIQGLNEIRQLSFDRDKSLDPKMDKGKRINKLLAKAISEGEVHPLDKLGMEIRYFGGDGLLNDLLHGRVSDEVIDGLKNDGMDEKQIKEALEKIKNNTLKNERDSKLTNEDTAVAPEKDTLIDKDLDVKKFGV